MTLIRIREAGERIQALAVRLSCMHRECVFVTNVSRPTYQRNQRATQVPGGQALGLGGWQDSSVRVVGKPFSAGVPGYANICGPPHLPKA